MSGYLWSGAGGENDMGATWGMAPSRPYPSRDEASAAAEQGAFYGQPSEPFMQAGQSATRITPTPQDAEDWYMSQAEGMRWGSENPFSHMISTPPEVADSFAQAALASRSSALASLGFDPRRVTTHARKDKFNISGAFFPTQDEIWTSGDHPSTVLHESLHRGIQKLKGEVEIPEEDEELIVRRMMQRMYNDVERGGGDVNDQQVAEAEAWADQLDPIIEKLEAAAKKRIGKQGVRAR